MIGDAFSFVIILSIGILVGYPLMRMLADRYLLPRPKTELSS
ncbi:MAG: hypothetical protein AAF530_17495 [Pseudomonadota bacterium]